MSEVRNRLSSSLAESRDHLSHLQADAIERGRQMTAGAEEYVHDHPWKVLGVVALAGIVIGALIARR